MSDLETKQIAAELLRETLNTRPRPYRWHLVIGVLYPAAVIAVELTTRWCAQTFFDPMPTWWHVLAVAAVPAGNLVLWLALAGKLLIGPRRLALLGGTAIGIAAFYALIFLPLLPLAIVGIIIYGIGLLPLGPLVSFVSACRLASVLKHRYPGRPLGKPIAGGIAAGLALLIALDVPQAATRLGVSWAASHDASERQRGLSLLRALGDGDLLLRLCYDSTGRPSGPLSAAVMFAGRGLTGAGMEPRTLSTETIREVYYRVHGEPFNSRPAPFTGGAWTRLDGFDWDGDQGGTDVGGRVKGLDLVSSRMDGTIDAADGVSYLEWIVEFRNTSLLDREARVQLALPPGGVVSRATLWVNGEEREAAYVGRGEVRAAYERVAIRQGRDPLLVTTKGADRVLAQAFPVPRNGGTIKFKIGITAPLELDTAGTAHVVLPAIADRNFSISTKTPHKIWIESKSPVRMDGGMVLDRTGEGNHRVQAELSDLDLARRRPRLTVERPESTGAVLSRLHFGPEVVQHVVSVRPAPPSALSIVIDGSAKVSDAAAHAAAALDTIPMGAMAGVIIASEPLQELAIAPWSAEQREKALALIQSASFTGGQDNTAALVRAMTSLEAHKGALLWIHGPQPVTFGASSGLFEQAVARLERLPQLWLYETEPGPNALLPDLPFAWNARTIPPGGAVKSDIEGFLKKTFDERPRPELRRLERKPLLASEAAAGPPSGSAHIARLWARDNVLTLAAAAGRDAQKRKAAVDLAAEHRLVTPVSGAVVLETAQQYADHGLSPVSQSSVPTVPEPHEWALMIMACMMLAWTMWQQRAEARRA